MDLQIDLWFNIRFWWYITVIPVGIIGNLTCLLMVSMKQNYKMSTSVYQGALAIADTIVLISQGGFVILVNWLTKFFAVNTLNIMCKVLSYFLFSAAFYGTMIIMALLVERVIVVTRPLKAAVLLSPRRAMIVIITIIIIAFAYNIPIIFSATMADHFGLQCVSVSGYASVIYHMTKVILSGVIPFFAILTMNLMILCAVKSSRKQKKRYAGRKHHNFTISHISKNSDSRIEVCREDDVKVDVTGRQDDKMSLIEWQLTVMTMVVTLTFLFLTVPKYAQQVAFINIYWLNSCQGLVRFGRSALVTQQLYMLNSAINFFLYIVSGSKFRSDLKTLCKCTRRQRSNGAIRNHQKLGIRN